MVRRQKKKTANFHCPLFYYFLINLLSVSGVSAAVYRMFTAICMSFSCLALLQAANSKVIAARRHTTRRCLHSLFLWGYRSWYYSVMLRFFGSWAQRTPRQSGCWLCSFIHFKQRVIFSALYSGPGRIPFCQEFFI